MKSSFQRLKDCFIYEEREERWIILKMIVLQYNMHAQLLGINQIWNTYMQYLECDANLEFVGNK